jgi:hypothetical protein
MGLKVPYLADAGIEASANALLADYARQQWPAPTGWSGVNVSA